MKTVSGNPRRARKSRDSLRSVRAKDGSAGRSAPLQSRGWAWKFKPHGRKWVLCSYAEAYRACLHEDDMAGAECKRVRVRITEVRRRALGGAS